MASDDARPDTFHVEEHVIYQFMNTPVREYPFPHMLVENVFPEEYYAQILQHSPPLESFYNIAEGGKVKGKGAYSARYITELPAMRERNTPAHIMAFWEEMAAWMTQPRFMSMLFDKFRIHAQKRFQGKGNLRFHTDFRLVRDFTTYAIGPHTDTPSKVLSLLFYLPKDNSHSHLGTSVFQPTDPNRVCLGGPHYPFEGFRKLFTAPFKPNTVFLFFKTPNSFHGVSTIQDEEIERNVLLYNVYVDPVPEQI